MSMGKRLGRLVLPLALSAALACEAPGAQRSGEASEPERKAREVGDDPMEVCDLACPISEQGELTLEKAEVPPRVCELDSISIWDADHLAPSHPASDGFRKALDLAAEELGICRSWLVPKTAHRTPPGLVLGHPQRLRASAFVLRYYHCNAGTIPHGPHSQDIRVWVPDDEGKPPCVSVGDIRIAL
ncbi:MAG: hypothetical protein AAF690_24175 [Acidobacteriota bacterium]